MKDRELQGQAPETAGSFTLSAGDLQALAEEVGAALVNYVIGSGRPVGQEISVAAMTPAEWDEFFQLSFGAVSSLDEGIILGDFMFKDTGRHRKTEDGYVVTVQAREAELYLESAFGPGITLATIGKEPVDGKVTFAALSGEDPRVVQPLVSWDEAEAGPGRPVLLQYALGSEAGMSDAPPAELQVQVAPAPESPYGCYVTAFCLRTV